MGWVVPRPGIGRRTGRTSSSCSRCIARTACRWCCGCFQKVHTPHLFFPMAHPSLLLRLDAHECLKSNTANFDINLLTSSTKCEPEAVLQQAPLGLKYTVPFSRLHPPPSTGTRLTKQKLEASQAHSREKGYPVLSNVLLPRHAGPSGCLTCHGVS